MKRLLTPAEAAELLSISHKHLRWLTDAGQLRWVNIGLDGRRPTRRFCEDDLQEFIDARSERTCRYTANTANQNTPMTSEWAVVDFPVPQPRATGAKRNG